MPIFVNSIQEMQFKNPELLWALSLLLIPLIIHLFQLRRFKKTRFTNVKLLKKVVSESRRSSTLKKWLLLFARLSLIAALVLAFAQPFLANESALTKKENVIYVDNSFSMQLKKDGASLLENAVQDLIKHLPADERFSLFTNDRTFKNVTLRDIQNDLLTLSTGQNQLDFQEISLKGNTLFSDDRTTDKNLIIISDFQQDMFGTTLDSIHIGQRNLVQLSASEYTNISIDTAYLDTENIGQPTLITQLSSDNIVENTPVSLYNGDNLIAKTSASFDEENTAKVYFTLPDNKSIKGKIQIADTGLLYDNYLYFIIDEREKIRVLSVGPEDHQYLGKIYRDDEFIFSTYRLDNLNYGDLTNQNLIILNGLRKIPTSLATSLRSFTDDGNSITIIPSSEIDLNSYNLLVSNYFSTSIGEHVVADRNITNIAFSHPLYRNVFEKSVSNFQYPKVSDYYTVNSSALAALSFENGMPFLLGNDGFFLFSAPLFDENSSFKNSPLIVPTFYNMARQSLQLPELYNILGQNFTIDVPVTLGKDQILKVKKDSYEYIPRQQSRTKKVSLFFEEGLDTDGIYFIEEDQNPIKYIALNFPRKESKLVYQELERIPAALKTTSISSLFETIEKNNTVSELWKWFVILALLFMIIEILIQKYL